MSVVKLSYRVNDDVSQVIQFAAACTCPLRHSLSVYIDGFSFTGR